MREQPLPGPRSLTELAPKCLPVEQSDIASDGNLLAVPLKVGGREYAAWVDTGFTHNGLDKRPELARANEARSG